MKHNPFVIVCVCVQTSPAKDEHPRINLRERCFAARRQEHRFVRDNVSRVCVFNISISHRHARLCVHVLMTFVLVRKIGKTPIR